MHKKMIILSHDAMVWEDLDYLGRMPTLARALGLEIPDADGQPVEELLREDLT